MCFLVGGDHLSSFVEENVIITNYTSDEENILIWDGTKLRTPEKSFKTFEIIFPNKVAFRLKEKWPFRQLNINCFSLPKARIDGDYS